MMRNRAITLQAGDGLQLKPKITIMSFEEMVVAVIAIVGGLAFTSFMFWNIFNLIKTWINRKSGNSEINPQFFKALGEFKKNTERRLSNLEAITSDLEEEKYIVQETDDQNATIEVEEESQRNANEEKKDGGNLRNMLNE